MASSKHTPDARYSEGAASTSRSLLVRVKENDPAAWDRLVTLYAPLVTHWCRRLGVPEQDARDILQDVFGVLARSIDGFRRERQADSFRGWLRVITRNKVYDHYRKSNRQPSAVGGTDAYQLMHQLPDQLQEDSELGEQVDGEDTRSEHELLLRALELIRQDFAPNTWQAFWLVVVDGKSPREVSELLKLSSGAVRVAKCRVLQRLRLELGELLD